MRTKVRRSAYRATPFHFLVLTRRTFGTERLLFAVRTASAGQTVLFQLPMTAIIAYRTALNRFLVRARAADCAGSGYLIVNNHQLPDP